MHAWNSFMALGDSFTEGLNDPGPDGVFLGWADRLADILAEQHPGLRYANLAVRGKMMDDIITEQLPHALQERPELVTICAGGNDLILPGCNVDGLAERFERIVAALHDAGSTVLIFTGPDVKHMPVVRTVRSKVAYYNAHIWSIADKYHTQVVDLWGMRVLADIRAWSDDRLHFAPEGHQRIALRTAEVLGMSVAHRWDTPWPPAPPTNWVGLRRADLVWTRAHLLPWVRRQLRGQSMGDGMPPKRPELSPVSLCDQHDLVG